MNWFLYSNEAAFCTNGKVNNYIMFCIFLVTVVTFVNLIKYNFKEYRETVWTLILHLSACIYLQVLKLNSEYCFWIEIWTTVINQNCPTVWRLNLWNACYYALQNLLSTHFLCTNLMIKIRKFTCWNVSVWQLASHIMGRPRIERVSE